MAKLFIQELPTKEEIHQSAAELLPNADAGILFSNLLFMKVATELDNHFDNVLSNYSLSSGRFTLLYMLNNAPQGMVPSELANKAGVTQATISGLLNNMEKAGLLARHAHEKDGRSYVIKLTEKGLATLKEILPLWYPRVSNFWGQFSETEREGLNAILKRMIQNTEVLAEK
ncbi:MAG: MarR family transcriptional regulator [Bdellovibrio sp.]|nr:MarR family transcriptional regulator [Bdellovibrio sp.]